MGQFENSQKEASKNQTVFVATFPGPKGRLKSTAQWPVILADCVYL